MARDTASRHEGNAFTHFFERVDRALFPMFGPPPITEIEPEQRSLDEQTCPLCGHPMFEHSFDHSTPNTVMTCPTDERIPERDGAGPLNELGMPATGRRRQRYFERSETR